MQFNPNFKTHELCAILNYFIWSFHTIWILFRHCYVNVSAGQLTLLLTFLMTLFSCTGSLIHQASWGLSFIFMKMFKKLFKIKFFFCCLFLKYTSCLFIWYTFSNIILFTILYSKQIKVVFDKQKNKGKSLRGLKSQIGHLIVVLCADGLLNTSTIIFYWNIALQHFQNYTLTNTIICCQIPLHW